MPKVSAVIPVYNVQDFLPRCIESALSQTLADIEIICVDDGSTDRCPELLDQYAKRDSRVTVIHQPNSGYGKAMNTGLDVIKGEYFAVLESDDFILPDAYEILYTSAKRFDADVVRADYFDYRTVQDRPSLKAMQMSKDYSWYYRLIRPNSEPSVYMFPMHNWSGIHKSSFLREKHIRYNETPGASFQDNGFFFQVFSQTDRLLYIPRPCYCYRVDNPGSSIHSRSKVYTAAEEYSFIREFINNHPDLKEELDPVFYARKFRIYHQTFLRIGREFRPEFASFFRSEMLSANESGNLHPDLLSEKERVLLQYLLSSDREYISIATPMEECRSFFSLQK